MSNTNKSGKKSFVIIIEGDDGLTRKPVEKPGDTGVAPPHDTPTDKAAE